MSVSSVSTDPLDALTNQYNRPITIPFANRVPTTLDVYPANTTWEYIGTTPPTLYVTSGAGNWVSVVGSGNFPITRFVVGPAGQAGYQTLQSALNAANAVGGGQIWVQPGTYVENLTLYGNTSITGATGNSDAGTSGNCVIITGVHTPPSTGSFCFANVLLTSSTHIFSSTAVGTASLWLTNLGVNCTNGFTFNVPNWTGDLILYNTADFSTNNGYVDNSGGSTCFFISATLGAGSGNTMATTGPVILQEIVLNCPWTARTGTTIAADYVIFNQPLAVIGTASGQISNSKFITGANPCISYLSSAPLDLTSTVLSTSSLLAIQGTNVANVRASNIIFLGNVGFSGSPPSTPYTTITGSLTLGTASKLTLGSGTNQTAGTGILTSGVFTFPSTSVVAGDIIIPSYIVPKASPGILSAVATLNTVTVRSTDLTDSTSTISWVVIGTTV